MREAAGTLSTYRDLAKAVKRRKGGGKSDAMIS